MAFCAKCGSPVQGQFCGKCGARVGATPAAPPTPPAPPRPQASAGGPPPVYQPPVRAAGPDQPAPAQTTSKKRGPLFWILTGCLGLIVIGIIVVFSTGYFIFNKARQAGFDPALMQKNPGLAVAKMMAAANPDIEVLGVDEERGIIKVRDKKTGKSLAISFEDAKNGKIVFVDDQGQKLEMTAQGEGENASFEMKGVQGGVRFGGSVNLPSWLPAYPGAQAVAAMDATSNAGQTASYGFKTVDSIEKVASFYEQALQRAGFEVEKSGPEDNSNLILMAKDSSERSAHIMVVRVPEGTSVNISFEDKK